MILVITNKIDPTADLVISDFHNRGVKFVRFNTEDFPKRVKCAIKITPDGIEGHLDLGFGRKTDINQIKSVYYRRPNKFVMDERLSSVSKQFAFNECQSTINGLWMSLPCLWVNHPYYLQAAELKIYQLKIADQIGFHIPKSLITNDPELVNEFYSKCNEKIIAKVLSTGVVENNDDISFIYTTRILKEHLESIRLIKYSPCLFQEYIPKDIEIRVTVVGHSVFAAEIHSQNSSKTKDDWRRYDFPNTPHKPHTLPQNIEQKCIQLVEMLNLNFGAIDLILDPDGKYIFLEINPNGQWGWIQELTGLPICASIVDLLCLGHKNF